MSPYKSTLLPLCGSDTVSTVVEHRQLTLRTDTVNIVLSNQCLYVVYEQMKDILCDKKWIPL